MAELKKVFMSLVALGGQNPQIINVDFLKNYKIVPIDEPPFNELFQQEKPYTTFVSTPVFSNLAFGPIEFIVDEQRFQIRDNSIGDWVDTKILDIALKYYEILEYTPLKKVGINLASELSFKTSQEAMEFQRLFLPESAPVCGMIPNADLTASITLNYPEPDNGSNITLTINPLNKTNNNRGINFNYEFDFTDWQNFKEELEKMPTRAISSDSIINELLKAI